MGSRPKRCGQVDRRPAAGTATAGIDRSHHDSDRRLRSITFAACAFLHLVRKPEKLSRPTKILTGGSRTAPTTATDPTEPNISNGSYRTDCDPFPVGVVRERPPKNLHRRWSLFQLHQQSARARQFEDPAEEHDRENEIHRVQREAPAEIVRRESAPASAWRIPSKECVVGSIHAIGPQIARPAMPSSL
jgi:hypothetical protein